MLRIPVFWFSFAWVSLINSGQVQSDVIEVDFLTPGDGLLIRDTVNQREWVDPTKVTRQSVNQFLSSSIYVGHGFQFATAADVEQLFLAAGAHTISYGTDSQINRAENLPAAQLLASLMEHTNPFPQTNGNPWVYGYLDVGSPSRVSLGRFYPGFPIVNPVVAQFGIDTWMTFGVTNPESWTRNIQHSSIGVWAFRSYAAVPEPSSVAFLCGTFCCSLYLLRRRAGMRLR